MVRAHGIRGDILIKPLTDRLERFVVGARFFTDGPPAHVVVAAVRHHNEGLILTLAEVEDRTAAERLAKTTLTIAATERRALDDDEFWPEDLIGLRAVGPDAETLGTVTDVVFGAAQDRLVVTTPDGSAVEVPFVAALVAEPVGTELRIDPPEGLFGTEGSADVAQDAEADGRPGRGAAAAHEDPDRSSGA